MRGAFARARRYAVAPSAGGHGRAPRRAGRLVLGSPAMDEPRRPSHAPWALAVAAVAIVAIVVGGGLYVFRSVRSLPGEAIEGGRKALRDLREVAAAFRTGTVTTTFRSYATEVTGTTRLQFAELRQEELFERRDTEAVLWGALALPDVVVEARAPVTYTYFLDLDKEWRFRLEGRDVLVVVPPVEWNRPAVDVSALRYVVQGGERLPRRAGRARPPALRAHAAPRPARAPARAARAGGRAAEGRGLRRGLARPGFRRRRGPPGAGRVRRRAGSRDAAASGAAVALGIAGRPPAATASARPGSRSARRAGRRWPRRASTLPP